MMGKGHQYTPAGAIVGGLDVEKPPTQHLKAQINEDRRCRNLPVLAVFVAFWVGMIINSSYGWNKGDPRRLVYGLDYKGNMCGDKKASPDLSSLDVRYWQNPNQVYESAIDGSPINLVKARSICLKECPMPSNGSLTWVCDYPEGSINLTMQEWEDRHYDYFSLLTNSQKNSSLFLQGPCYPVLFQSTNLFWSCQFSASASASALTSWQNLGGVNVNQGDLLVQALHKAITAPSTILKRYAADLGRAWPVLVVCGGIAPLVISVLWLLIVRYFVGVMTWITVILLNILALAVTVFLYIKAGWIGHDAVSGVVGDQAADDFLSASASEKKHLKAVAIAMTVIFIIIVITTLVLIKRIIIAVAVIKVSTKAIGAIPGLFVLPFIPFVVLTLFFIYWVSAALYLFSAGAVTKNDCNGGCCAYDLLSQTTKCEGCCGYDYHFTKHIALALLYHIFGCFWTTQFIIACSLTTIAGAVASYYWAQGRTSAMPLFPVLSSGKRVLRYSLGSMALGSLVVAIIEMIRFILESIRNKLRALEAAPGGCIITMCWCCGQCCLGCVEWTIKFINRNAYIVIAITGKGFCGAAVKATSLIVNNILRIGTVNVIGDVVVFLGKVGVSLASALFAFFMLETSPYKSGHRKVSSPLFPVLVNVDEFELKGDTLNSVNKPVNKEEERLYVELYKELEETDRRITRTRRGRGRGRGRSHGRSTPSTTSGKGKDKGKGTRDRVARGRGQGIGSSGVLTYVRHGSGSRAAALSEEDDALSSSDSLREPEYDDKGNLLSEGDFVFTSETDENEGATNYFLASDHTSDEDSFTLSP